MNAMIITDLSKYKAEIARYVEGMVLGALLYMSRADATKAIEKIAVEGLFIAPFLYQGTNERQFNRDIAEYCQKQATK